MRDKSKIELLGDTLEPIVARVVKEESGNERPKVKPSFRPFELQALVAALAAAAPDSAPACLACGRLVGVLELELELEPPPVFLNVVSILFFSGLGLLPFVLD